MFFRHLKKKRLFIFQKLRIINYKPNDWAKTMSYRKNPFNRFWDTGKNWCILWRHALGVFHHISWLILLLFSKKLLWHGTIKHHQKISKYLLNFLLIRIQASHCKVNRTLPLDCFAEFIDFTEVLRVIKKDIEQRAELLSTSSVDCRNFISLEIHSLKFEFIWLPLSKAVIMLFSLYRNIASSRIR